MVDAGAVVRPWLTVGRGWAVYVGPVEPGRLHSHQAAQLAWCTEGTLRVEGAWGALESTGHVLSAGVPHRLVAAQPVRMVFLDPSMAGRGAAWVRRAETAAALTAAQAQELERQLEQWRQHPEPHVEHCPFLAVSDERWEAVVAWLEQSLHGPIRVEEAAAAVNLSSSRFMHWFAEVSGMPFRAYLRWLRLQCAVRTLADGSTLTEAAHMAGFADSAHLTRTFVATFGVRPAPLRAAQIVCTDSVTPPIATFGLDLLEAAIASG